MAALEWILGVLALVVWVAGMVVFLRGNLPLATPFMAGTALLLLAIRALHGRRARLEGGPPSEQGSLWDWLP